MKGQKASPPKPNSAEFCFVTFFGVFIALLCVSACDVAISKHIFNGEEMKMMVGAWGALATLLFGAPVAPLAQPRMVFGGHIISVTVAILVNYLTDEEAGVAAIPQWVSTALAPALSITLMAATGFTHPPAGACSLIYISAGRRLKAMGWLFMAVPAISSSMLMVSIALVINNLSNNSKYPLFW